jgi:hypothetical protein
MSRIRTIKPEFWSSEQVIECSPLSRLLFIGLWNFCDDYGRHSFSPRQIKALVFPADNFSADEVSKMLGELAAHGLILIYDADEKTYLEVTGWSHQKIDRKNPSRCPDPPSNSTNVRRIFDDHSTINHPRKGREGNRK